MLIAVNLAWFNQYDYQTMCANKAGVCYNLWSDKDYHYSPAHLDYTRIAFWDWIMVNVNLTNAYNYSIGWAQATTMALSYSRWMGESIENGWRTTIALQGLPIPFPCTYTVFQVMSVIKAGLENGNSCLAPNILYQNNNISSHWNFQPFIVSGEGTAKITDDPAFAYPREPYPLTYCNYKALSSINTTGIHFYTVPIVNNMYMKGAPTSTWLYFFRGFGIGVVGIPNDYLFGQGFGYYADGFLIMAGPILYYYAATVVGVWVANSTNTYLLVYAFGASNRSTNYLWVDYSQTSYKYYVSWYNAIF